MDDLLKRHEQMVYPAVRMVAWSKDGIKRVGGSGTVIYSQNDKEGKARTFIIGCHHVVEGAIKIKEEWNSRLGRDVKKEFLEKVECQTFKYNKISLCIGTTGIEADIVAYDKDHDLALCELADHENTYPYVAEIIPHDKECKILLSSEVWAVGAALGHAPVLTSGYLNFKDDILDGKKYWLSSAQIIFGNSGGAVFWLCPKDNLYYFIGVPAQMAVTGSMWGLDAITHMGYFVPPDRIYEFLADWDFQFIYDPKQTIEECEKRRKKKKEEERKQIELVQGLIKK